jgi:hypothetical protein
MDLIISSDKSLYKDFCDSEKNLPVFHHYDWLEILCKDDWNVRLCLVEGKVVGVLPFMLKKKYFLKFISFPRFTPYLGIYLINEVNPKLNRKIKTSLISSIPSSAFSIIHNNIMDNDMLPWIWKEYQCKFKYTHIISNDHKNIYANLYSDSLLKKIKNKKNKFYIKQSNQVNELIEIMNDIYIHNGLKIRLNQNLLNSIIASKKLIPNLLLLLDESKKIHSASLTIEDNQNVYNLFSGRSLREADPDAHAIILDEVIIRALNRNKNFDFMGSSLKGVEEFISSFGGQVHAYPIAMKYNNTLMRLVHYLYQKIQ